MRSRTAWKGRGRRQDDQGTGARKLLITGFQTFSGPTPSLHQRTLPATSIPSFPARLPSGREFSLPFPFGPHALEGRTSKYQAPEEEAVGTVGGGGGLLWGGGCSGGRAPLEWGVARVGERWEECEGLLTGSSRRLSGASAGDRGEAGVRVPAGEVPSLQGGSGVPGDGTIRIRWAPQTWG